MYILPPRVFRILTTYDQNQNNPMKIARAWDCETIDSPNAVAQTTVNFAQFKCNQWNVTEAESNDLEFRLVQKVL